MGSTDQQPRPPMRSTDDLVKKKPHGTWWTQAASTTIAKVDGHQPPTVNVTTDIIMTMMTNIFFTLLQREKW